MGKGKGTSWLEVRHTNTPVQKEWCQCPRKLARNKLDFGQLCHVILKRIQNELEKPLRSEQCRFSTNCSCADPTFTLRVLIEESREWCSKLYMIFIDFEKAIDSVDRVSLWKNIFYYGIPCKIISIILHQVNTASECCIKTPEGQTI